MKTYSYREFIKILNNNGYVRDRVSGSHIIYINGSNTISITHNHINKMIVRRLIKEYNLEVK